MVSRKEDDERSLVNRCNAGDVDAFESMYQTHRQWVFSLAIRFLGNREDALDVLQEVFADLFQRFPGFRLTSTMRAFLYPVVKHGSISMLRKRHTVVNLDEMRDQGQESNIGLVWQSETPGDLDRMIIGLPAGQQEVVRLRFELDLKIHEIAAALEIPPGTVKSRLHNALETLRKK